MKKKLTVNIRALTRWLRILRNVALAAFLVMAFGGCGQLPTGFKKIESKAMSDTDNTRIGRGISPLVADHPERSGFVPLANGIDAFVARLALAEASDRTLDVQYYLFHDDTTGRLLAGYLLKAADRGVRVRLLLDDMDMGGRDVVLSSLAEHPNIEIRLFNPFSSREMRYFDFITNFGNVSRRMHNKSFTADNQVTIVGGRNIGDEYFEASEGVNFVDMDVLAVGSIVRRVSDVFDRYWNSDLAYPITAFESRIDPEFLKHSRAKMSHVAKSFPASVYGRRLQETNLARDLVSGEVKFIWARAQLLYDLPEKVLFDTADLSTHYGPKLWEFLASVDSDLILVSPYFVPGKRGTALLASLVKRGCRVTILTNSLAATDVPFVHGGYARYRKTLVESGVEVYEMPPNSISTEKARSRGFGKSLASLHAKTIVFDKKKLLVGSMNLDPRSSLLNTEMGIVIDSVELARLVSDWRDETLPEIAWRIQVERVEDPDSWGVKQPRLVWISQKNGSLVRRHDYEPEASVWARIQAAISRLLPIEKQL